MGSERPDLGSGRPNLGFERPDLRSVRSDLGSERPDMGSEGPYLRLAGGGDGQTDRRTHGHTETGENCPMWNHRSSAPPGPLPKKHNEMRGYKLQSAKDVKNMAQIATKYRDS